jgi:penicillin G amidase
MSEFVDALREMAAAAVPPVDGEIALPGLHEPVEVVRDTWGVPHIRAANREDLFFAQGFVQASERLFQMDLAYRLATGRLAEALGEAGVPMDRFVRTAGWNRAGRRIADAGDPLSREILTSFLSGCRAWLDAMPSPPVEYAVLGGLRPWLPEPEEHDVVAAASVFMAWTLSGNWDVELLRTEIADALGWDAVLDLFPDLPTEAGPVIAGTRGGPDRETALELLRQAPPFPKGQGSNNWVVSGRRSVTGKPLLANDPHLLAQLPSIWIEVHLTAPGIDAVGVALPFAPGVTIGHNERIAWGFTNVGGDTQDLYLERLNEQGTAALYAGAWEPFATYREEITVRGREEPDIVLARETRHGPILDSYLLGTTDSFVAPGGLGDTYALRFVGFEHTIQPSTTWRLNTAGSWDEFRDALRAWHCPGQNVVYADIDGHIGYQCTGLHPIRQSGDGTIPVPGWTAEHEWDGWIPFDELPRAFDPADGFLVTANNKPHDDSYPWLLGHDFLPAYRARRIAQRIAERPLHDAASFASIQMDTVSLPARELVPLLLEIEPGSERQSGALELLVKWDGDLRADSAAAALYQVWNVKIAETVLVPRIGEDLYRHYHSLRQWTNAFQFQALPNLLRLPTARWFGEDGTEARDRVLRDALDAALDQLGATLGDDPSAWHWGDLHRVRFAGLLARVPGLGELFTAGEAPMGGDEQTILQGMYAPGEGYGAAVIPSWRMIADPSDWDRSLGTHTLGQSGHPASPHFNDLFGMWLAGEHHQMPFSGPAVEAAAESRLRLVPR